MKTSRQINSLLLAEKWRITWPHLCAKVSKMVLHRSFSIASYNNVVINHITSSSSSFLVTYAGKVIFEAFYSLSFISPLNYESLRTHSASTVFLYQSTTRVYHSNNTTLFCKNHTKNWTSLLASTATVTFLPIRRASIANTRGWFVVKFIVCRTTPDTAIVSRIFKIQQPKHQDLVESSPCYIHLCLSYDQIIPLHIIFKTAKLHSQLLKSRLRRALKPSY